MTHVACTQELLVFVLFSFSFFFLPQLREKPAAAFSLVDDWGSECVFDPVMHTQHSAGTHRPPSESKITAGYPVNPLTVNLVDLGVLWQNFISQFLCRRQHLSVMHCDQVLHKFLQLISVHLKKSLWDGQAQFDLLRLPHSVQRECHDVGAVENVLVATDASHCSDLTPVEADAHVADQLWLRGCGGLPDCAAQVKPCTKTGTNRTQMC